MRMDTVNVLAVLRQSVQKEWAILQQSLNQNCLLMELFQSPSTGAKKIEERLTDAKLTDDGNPLAV